MKNEFGLVNARMRRHLTIIIKRLNGLWWLRDQECSPACKRRVCHMSTYFQQHRSESSECELLGAPSLQDTSRSVNSLDGHIYYWPTMRNGSLAIVTNWFRVASSLTPLRRAKQPSQPAVSRRFAAEGRTSSHIKDMTMKNVTMKHPVAMAIAGAMIIGFATTSWAAPVLSNAAALVGAAPSTAIHVDDRSAASRSRAHTLQNLEFGTYGAQPSPSTPTPSNDVTALPRDTNRAYGTTRYPLGLPGQR
jgi:hypothetical protein